MTKYPAFIACVLVMIGVIIGDTIHLPDFVSFSALVLLISTGVIFLCLKHSSLAKLTVCLVMVGLGLFRMNLLSANLPPNHISRFNDLIDDARIMGRIVREPDLRPEKTFLTIDCDSILVRGKQIPSSGLVLVQISRYDDRFSYADRISVDGRLLSPKGKRSFESFDYRRYLSLKNIHTVVYVKHCEKVRVTGSAGGDQLLSKLIIPLRNYILEVFGNHLRGSERNLVAGFLIGEIRFIPPDIYDRFRDTGTLHLLAVSGSNVALVIAPFMLLLKALCIPRRMTYFLSLIIIFVFCQLSFNQPSVVRASLMIGLVLLGKIIYCRGNLLNIISVSALLILLVEPMMLFDVGFQLSFAAAFSLVFFLKDLLPRQRKYPAWKRWLREHGWMIVLSSVVVQIMVAPILAYYFGRIPVITFLSNLVVIPLASAAVILSLALTAVAQIPVLSETVSVCTQAVLHLAIRSVDMFASVPAARIDIGSPSLISIGLYYVSVFVLYRVIQMRKNLRSLVSIGLMWAALIVWGAVTADSDEALNVTFLDAGGNYCVHVHMPCRNDFVLTDAKWNPDFDVIDRVVKPYLIDATGCDSAEIVTGCPVSSFDSPVPIGDVIPVEAGTKTTPSGESGIRMLQTDAGVTSMGISCLGSTLVLMTSWSQIATETGDQKHRIDILALPYPKKRDLALIPQVLRIGPKTVVLYTSPFGGLGLHDDAELSRLACNGTRLIESSKSGAIRCAFGRGHLGVTPTRADK